MTADEIRVALRDYIRAKGTQEEVAKRLDTPPATVSRWLNGKRPLPLATLDKLLTAAKVDLLTLVSLSSGDTGVAWQSAPVLLLRSLPPMEDDFSALVEAAGDATKDRIALPFKDAPAVAVRIPHDLPEHSLLAGQVVAVVPPAYVEPGKPAVIQVQGRTEIGTYQLAHGVAQVVADGHVYQKGEYVLVGRVRGVWRDI